MKIISKDKKSIISLERKDLNDPHSAYTFTVEFKNGDNSFKGTNDCVHFAGFQNFLKIFEKFLVERKNEAILDLTEECKLIFFVLNHKREVGVKIKLSKFVYSTDPMKTNKIELSGEFKLNSEYLNTILDEFKALSG